jgi:hypothetical protein
VKLVPVEREDLTLPDLAEMAKDGPVILTRKGRPVVAVKDLAGQDWECVSLANNPRFVAIIEASRRSYRRSGGISIDRVRSELGLKGPRSGRRVRRPTRKR